MGIVPPVDVKGPGWVIPWPRPTEWAWSFTPEFSTRYLLPGGARPPCRFHRFMQRIILGVYWRKE